MGNNILNLNLLGQKIKKKQLNELLPQVDVMKKGGAWQTEFKRAQTYGNVEIVGRQYIVHEIYDTPKERVHGNVGKEPANKGQFDTNSLKYHLAETLIKLDLGDYVTKNGLLDAMGFNSKNLKNFAKMFKNSKYHELDTLDKFAFDEVSGIETSLSRLIRGALDIIAKSKFPNVELYEQIYFANNDNEHFEAEELENWEQLYLLCKQARKQAGELVEQQYGKKLIFDLKMHYTDIEYEKLIFNEDKYEALYNDGISYFYTKYLIENNNVKQAQKIDFDYENFDYDGSEIEEMENEDIAYEFLTEFIEHRIENAEINVDKLIKAGVTGDFFNKEIMMEFVKLFIPFVFDGQLYSVFKRLYKDMIAEAKENYSFALEESVDEALSGLAW